MKAAGITSPPTTLAQLYADHAKKWKVSGNKIEPDRHLPRSTTQGFEYFASFFGAVNCFNSAGQYDFASCPGAATEANFFAQYDSYGQSYWAKKFASVGAPGQLARSYCPLE